MAIPATRDDFKAYCLRKLGAPVIEINVDDDQIEDRIDEALKYYWDYHFDGSEKLYYKHQINANNVIDKYISKFNLEVRDSATFSIARSSFGKFIEYCAN